MMVKRSLFALILGLFFLIFPRTVQANGNDSEVLPLCPPELFYDPSQECIPLGPTAYLLDMAEIGITFPETPLPVQMPDPALSEVEYTYAYVISDRAPIYLTLDDAINQNGSNIVRWITPGFNYVSITQTQYANGQYYHYTEIGWMSGKDLVIASIPKFQGVEFSKTPQNAFGWVLSIFAPGGVAETKRTPGYDNDDFTGHYLKHMDVVQIYDVQKVGKWDWYLIGPEEWLIQTAVAKITPKDKPPEGMTWDRWIEVDLYEQTLVVYDDREMVFATVVATGRDPFWTYPGIFSIEEKLDLTRMRWLTDPSFAYNLEDVPWTMYFDESRAFHGAYWRANLGYPQSHGCVNLSVGDSHWLFDWAKVGDRVYVFDPSGKTPLSEADR
jgi:hypothetical protein